MRIATVLNKKTRELYTHQRIREALLRISPSSEVQIFDSQTATLDEDILRFYPDLILTYYGGGKWQSDRYYRFKETLKCKIIRLATEGIFQVDHPEVLEQNLGFDEYGPDLYDYELVWGERIKEVFAPVLVGAKKLRDDNRMRYFGHPAFELYNCPADLTNIPEEVLSSIKDIPKSNILLFATGFPYACYTEQNLVDARDLFNPEDTSLESQRRKEEALEAVRKSQLARNTWINMLSEIAEAFPQILLLLKIHPLENNVFQRQGINPYQDVLGTYPNILCIDNPVNIGDLLGLSGLFFHYGSTSNIDAYLREVPSVLVEYPEIANSGGYSRYFSVGGEVTPTDLRQHHSLVKDFIGQHLQSPIQFVRREETEKFMKEFFNLSSGMPYNPSERIAEFLLSLAGEPTLLPGPEDDYRTAALRRDMPQIADFHLRQMVSEINANNAEAAIRYSTQLLAISSEVGCAIDQLQYLNGVAHMMNGELQKAERALQAELSLNPQHQHARRLLGELGNI